jgi:hypothetical protein
MKKKEPDVLRVVEYIQFKSAKNEAFSVSDASKSAELNGIGDYRIAEIMRSICLEPNGPNTLEKYTSVNGDFTHSNQGKWALNPEAYFGYLGYQSNKYTEKALKLTTKSFWVAIATLIITVIIFTWENNTAIIQSVGETVSQLINNQTQ